MRELEGHLVALFTVAIWGITFISTKILLNHMGPEHILFLRFLIGWIALWVICPQFLPFSYLNELTFAAAGFFGITLYFLLENIALQYTMAANVGVLVSTAPFFTALVNWLLFKGAPLSARFYCGFLLAMAGITLLSGRDVEISLLGDVLAILAALAWAFYSVFTRKLANLGFGVFKTTRRTFFYGLLLMLPIMYFKELPQFANILWQPEIWGNILFLGLGASALCFATWTFCLVRLGTNQASAYIYLVPVITVIAASFWLKESLNGLEITGIILVLAGLILSEGRLKIPGNQRISFFIKGTKNG